MIDPHHNGWRTRTQLIGAGGRHAYQPCFISVTGAWPKSMARFRAYGILYGFADRWVYNVIRQSRSLRGNSHLHLVA
jgi:hypothetical protein